MEQQHQPSLEFKQKVQTVILPCINHLIKKETKHLMYLIRNNASTEYINRSSHRLKHYKQRQRQYTEYCNTIK